MSEPNFAVHQPHGQLRRYVREMLSVRSTRPRTQLLLPETNLTLVLRQSGSASLHENTLPHAIVSGLQQRARIVEHAPHSSLLIVRFTEIGAAAILHEQPSLLYNRTLPLDSLLPSRGIDEIQNRLASTRDVARQFLAAEQFLSARIDSRYEISPQIEAAIRMIRASEGRASIHLIARHVAMSLSSLERHFREAVGTTPKNLSRLARLHHVCHLWHTGKTLTEIAFEAGFCDQPHLIRDFQLFAGASPEQILLNRHPHNLPTFYK